MTNETAVLGNFQMTLPGPNGASLSISGYMYAGESQESLIDRMDTCREALADQQMKLEIPVLQEKIAQLEKMREQCMSAYADLLEKQKRNALASAEKPHLKNYPLQIRQIEEEIEKGAAKIRLVQKAA